ncbi:MAG: hypothetical protein AAFO75_10745, partial [Pseudomonadota bacterium]
MEKTGLRRAAKLVAAAITAQAVVLVLPASTAQAQDLFIDDDRSFIESSQDFEQDLDAGESFELDGDMSAGGAPAWQFVQAPPRESATPEAPADESVAPPPSEPAVEDGDTDPSDSASNIESSVLGADDDASVRHGHRRGRDH